MICDNKNCVHPPKGVKRFTIEMSDDGVDPYPRTIDLCPNCEEVVNRKIGKLLEVMKSGEVFRGD